MSTPEEIEAAALRLPLKDRLHLAEAILNSFPGSPPEPDEILAESVRGDDDVENEKVTPFTEEAFWAGVRRRSP